MKGGQSVGGRALGNCGLVPGKVGMMVQTWEGLGLRGHTEGGRGGMERKKEGKNSLQW